MLIAHFFITILLIFRQQFHHQNHPMASWVEGEPDHVNEPVEDHAPAAIFLSLLHGHVEPNREGGRPDPGVKSGLTALDRKSVV